MVPLFVILNIPGKKYVRFLFIDYLNNFLNLVNKKYLKTYKINV